MWFHKSIKLEQFTYLFTFMISAIAIIAFQSDRYQKVKTQIENPDYLQQEKESLTTLNLRKLTPSFGFDNLIADSIYLQFVQYFGDETARKATGYSLVPQYFAAIAKHDPQFTAAYLTLATANSMYAGKAEETVSLIDRVLQTSPTETKNSHLLWTVKAIDETIFLGDIDAAKHSYLTAAQLARQENHDRVVEAVSYNQQKAQFLATKPDTTEAQIIAWKSVLPHVVKEHERQIIRDRIAALEAQLN